MILEGGGDGQSKKEFRSLIDFRLGPDASAVARDDALDDREADAGAGKLALPMQALKDAKQLVAVAPVEGRAVAAHAVNQLCAASLAGDASIKRTDSPIERPGGTIAPLL